MFFFIIIIVASNIIKGAYREGPQATFSYGLLELFYKEKPNHILLGD